MNGTHRDYWYGYLRELGDRLRLVDWHIIVLPSPASDGRIAECQCSYGRKSIAIQFQKGFGGLDPPIQRGACCHELLHAHFAAHGQHMHNARQMMSKYWLHQLGDTMHVHLEYALDALTDIIAPFLPLPPDPGIPDAPDPANGGGDDALQERQTATLPVQVSPEDRETMGEGSGRQSQDQAQTEESVATRARARMAALERPLA